MDTFAAIAQRSPDVLRMWRGYVLALEECGFTRTQAHELAHMKIALLTGEREY